MKMSLAGLVEELVADFPPGFIDASAAERVLENAAVLPAVHRILLECALAPGASSKLDLSQCILAEDFEIARLRECVTEVLKRSEPGGSRPGWEAADSFLDAWSDPMSSVRHMVDNIWLELDSDPRPGTGGRGRCPGAPGLFCKFPYRPDPRLGDDPRGSLHRAVRDVLDAVGSSALAPRLCAEIDALPLQGTPSHIGIWLGRSRKPVRLNVLGLEADQAIRHLERIMQLESSAVPTLERLYDLSGKTFLTYDVDTDGLSRFGIECFSEDRFEAGGELEELLLFLVSQGLASGERMASVMKWPGYAAFGPADSLLLLKRVNHVKVMFSSRGLTEAKVYLRGEDVSSETALQELVRFGHHIPINEFLGVARQTSAAREL